MYIIMLDDNRAYGRLFNSEKDAKKWQDRYEINGTIVEYTFHIKEEDNERSKLEG